MNKALPDNDRHLLGLAFFKTGLFSNKGFWFPISDELVDLILPQLDVIGAVGGIRGRQQVAHEEDNEHELNGRPNWVVLVARLNVSGQDSTARDSLEGLRQAMQQVLYIGLSLV